MNIDQILQTVHTVSNTPTQRHPSRTTNGLVVRTGVRAGATPPPGVISGNLVQAPVHVPVNTCGNSANVIGLLNPAFGNMCVND